MKKLFLSLMVMGFAVFVNAQQNRSLIQNYLSENVDEWGLSQSDIQGWLITDQTHSKNSGVTHVYIRQAHDGVGVFDAVGNFNIADGKVLNAYVKFVKNLSGKVNASAAQLSPVQAVEHAARHLNLQVTEPLQIVAAESQEAYTVSKGGISTVDIKVRLMYQPMPEGEVRIAWDMALEIPEKTHYWNLRVDALTGAVLDQQDYTLHCDFGTPGHSDAHATHAKAELAPLAPRPPRTNNPDEYRVFAPPLESPNHGNRTLMVNPADAVASPYGWHDTNGAAGAEYTITRGNNVLASEDRNADNNPGYSPDGGASLVFDYPLNFNQQPSGYEDAAITNLFVWNNLTHDVWYRYGFDEQSGNFQDNNYGNGGIGGDYVNADAQDGAGTNNANFSSPPDGSNGRMQMFLWTNGGGNNDLVYVNSPSVLAGPRTASQAAFGPGVPTTPLTADLALATDGTAPDIYDCCDPITNGAAVSGKIAILRRGNCTFVSKVEEAQAKGAVGVIIVNNVPGAPVGMGGFSGSITIPSVMISQGDGETLIDSIIAGNTINATLVDSTGNFDTDGDFDNGIIVHEYGHGISIRLTGGGNNSSCLNNAEQMGEGWSDWFGLMMTIEPGDTGTDVRGIGTFAIGQSVTGGGIRNAPYSTDFNVNNFTYAATNNTAQVAQPHGIGFVWCTMLWDMTWALIDQYGFDPNQYTGTGGNNIAMALVTEGCKLQPCNPGFVDGRDAILLADQQLYGGANQCLIWEAFAGRGLGWSADQGSSGSRTDQVEAFDLPPTCLTATQPPIAAFSHVIGPGCGGDVDFTDTSVQTPQAWDWDFGDGNNSTTQNPSHTYTASGTYNVTLIVTNTLGADTITQQVVIQLPQDPTVQDGEACINSPVTLTGTATDKLNWYDMQGNYIGTGSPFQTPPLSSQTSYQAQNVIAYPVNFVGPSDNSIGGGGYHGTGFTGTVNFTASAGLTVISAWVDAEYAGVRDFNLWDDIDGNGNILQTVSVNIPFSGPGRVDLGFQVPGPGDYSIGGTGVDLYRNNSGANYPYTVANLITMTGSSAGNNFYYYLYDWEVQQDSCVSGFVPVTASVVDADFSFTFNLGNYTFTDQSVGATSWSWDFGDGNSSNAQNPTHSYAANGQYIVTLTINGGSCTFTDTLDVIAINVEEATDIPTLSLQPNPTSSITTLLLSQVAKKDIFVEVVDLQGRLLVEATIGKGTKSLSLDLGELPDAMYFVNLTTDESKVTHKIVVRH